MGDSNDLFCLLSDSYFDELLTLTSLPLQTPGSDRILNFDKLRDPKPSTSTSTSTSTVTIDSQSNGPITKSSEELHFFKTNFSNMSSRRPSLLNIAVSKPLQSVVAHGLNSTTSSPSSHTGRWTTEEHRLFLQGLQKYGKSWKKIACLVPTRTLVQIRTHAQKFLMKKTWDHQLSSSASALNVNLHVNGPVGTPTLQPKSTTQSNTMSQNVNKPYQVRLKPATTKNLAPETSLSSSLPSLAPSLPMDINTNHYHHHQQHLNLNLSLNMNQHHQSQHQLPAHIPFYHHPLAFTPASPSNSSTLNLHHETHQEPVHVSKKRRLSAAICESESRAKLGVLEMPISTNHNDSDDIFDNIVDILDGKSNLDWLSALENLTPQTTGPKNNDFSLDKKPTNEIKGNGNVKHEKNGKTNTKNIKNEKKL